MVCHPAFTKALAASLPEMLASRANSLNRNKNFGLLAVWVARHCFLILRPEPCGDRFLDIGESFQLIHPLGHAPGQGRAFDNEPAVFRFVERYVEYHVVILSIAASRDNA